MEFDQFAQYVNMLEGIREFYLTFETDESVDRKKALNQVIYEMNCCGIPGTIIFNGSLTMGMSERHSDIDYLYVGDMSKLNFSDIGPFLQERLYERLNRFIEVDFSPSLNLTDVRTGIESDHPGLNNELVRFYQLCKTWAHLDDRLDQNMAAIEELRSSNQTLDLRLRRPYSNVIINNWEPSFHKYHERLEKRGIDIPVKQRTRESVFSEMLYL